MSTDDGSDNIFKTFSESVQKHLQFMRKKNIENNFLYTKENLIFVKDAFVKDNEIVDKNKADFEKYCHMFGLKKEDYGKSFRQNAKVFTVSGLNFKARKNNIELTCSDGKTYKGSSENVKRLLDLAK